jgi:hypothetical protein
MARDVGAFEAQLKPLMRRAEPQLPRDQKEARDAPRLRALDDTRLVQPAQNKPKSYEQQDRQTTPKANVARDRVPTIDGSLLFVILGV